jgi:hypothetical protein
MKEKVIPIVHVEDACTPCQPICDSIVGVDPCDPCEQKVSYPTALNLCKGSSFAPAKRDQKQECFSFDSNNLDKINEETSPTISTDNE